MLTADNESDSGYDPSLYSSFGLSGSFQSVSRTRPSLKAVFPEIIVSDENGQEINNGIPPPPSTAFLSKALSMESLHQPRSKEEPPQTDHNSNINKQKEKEKRDIYKEAFESTKRAEEAKFKMKFDKILEELKISLDNQALEGLEQASSAYDSTSYGEAMVSYKNRVREVLVSLSQRLELAIESFDESNPSSAMATSQKVKQMVSKLVEDKLGESLDLTSDEAVSDLSSLSDESGDHQKSFEDQLAQAIIAKFLENLRKEAGVQLHLAEAQDIVDSGGYSSGIEDQKVERAMSFSDSEDKNETDTTLLVKTEERRDSFVNSHFSEKEICEFNGQEIGEELTGIDSNGNTLNKPKEDRKGDSEKDVADICEPVDEKDILEQEFEKLRSFATVFAPRPLYEVHMREEIEEEPIEEVMESVKVNHNESLDEFEARCSSYERVHGSHLSLPDFDDVDFDADYSDGSNREIDPDLLSMNMIGLDPIEEETEEELETDKNESTSDDLDWRRNWIFKGNTTVSPYSNVGLKRVGEEHGNVYMMTIPQPKLEYAPQIGNRDADELSDFSDYSGEKTDSSEGLSDEESAFYSKTSEEIERITRISSNTQTQNSSLTSISVQTDESDADTSTSKALSSSFSDSGIKNHSSLDRSKAEDNSSKKPSLKLSEELIPAVGGDPKFEISPESFTVPEGEPAKFSCRVCGTAPVDVFWYKVSGEEVKELEESEKYEIVKEMNKYHVTMFNLTQEDAGQYMCIAINEKGQCCQYFILSIKKNTQEFKAPEFIKGIQDAETKEAQSFKFRCKVKGYPQPRVVWYKDGHIIKPGGNCRLEKFGNRDYLLAFDCVTMDDDAEYTVMAKNIAGEAKSLASLIVEPCEAPEEKSAPRDLASPTMQRDNLTPKSSVELKKDDHNLNNLTQKVMMTKDSVSVVAEDMLHSTKKNEKAANVRKVTSSALDVLNSVESSLKSETYSLDSEILSPRSETHSLDWLATSTPRSSTDDINKIHVDRETIDPLRIEKVASQIEEDKHTTEITFNFSSNRKTNTSHLTPISSRITSSNLSPTFQSNKDSHGEGTKTITFAVNRPELLHVHGNISHDHEKITETNDQDPVNSEISSLVSLDTLDSTDSLKGSKSLEPTIVNLGPKRIDSQQYSRDFYVNNSPKPQKKKWEVKLTGAAALHQSSSDVDKTEEEVKSVENTVQSLRKNTRPRSPEPPPQPTHLVGLTSETELPESRTEFNEEYSVELPSVNRLKAMFSNDDSSSIKRLNQEYGVHSITARSLPKEKLERLKSSKSTENVTSTTLTLDPSLEDSNAILIPGRATALMTGQHTKEAKSQPKQIFQSTSLQKEKPEKSPRKIQPISVSVTSKFEEPVRTNISSTSSRTSVYSESRKENSEQIKAYVPGKSKAPQPSSETNKTVSTKSEIEGRKSPRIRSGAISARAAYWEKRIIQGPTDDDNDSEFPDIVQNE
ncbi:hypothetical protein CHS0354_007810 [Potamilus streckersoni]|uniref:Ig-like domain-containing protein n=1 Tax=Potamilus streckersoni TaxID=2493646 RepID=A0AAE0VHH5_9BIVA|nr:hypothetical protein CHS0354_007810 [Potamilus streckersoni]